MPDTSVKGYSWVAANDETKTAITHLKCVISKDSDGFPVSEMEKYEASDFDECKNVNPKTGQPYCDMKQGKCINSDAQKFDQHYVCSCESGFDVFDNRACTYYGISLFF